MFARIVMCLVAAALSSACVPQPSKQYTVEQVRQIDSLEELMRVNASKMDPWMAKRDQASFTPEEFAAMNQAALYLQASTARLEQKFGKSSPATFVAEAKRLGEGADKLITASKAKDAPGARASLTDVRNTCKSCHAKHK